MGTGDRGPGRAGGRTESVMEAPGQQRKKSVKRGEREGGPPSLQGARHRAQGFHQAPFGKHQVNPLLRSPPGLNSTSARSGPRKDNVPQLPQGLFRAERWGGQSKGRPRGTELHLALQGARGLRWAPGPPQSPAWSPRGPRLRLSLPHVTEAASRGSAGASSPNSAPRVGKLRLRGDTRDGWPGQSSPYPTPSPPHPHGQLGTHQGPGQGSWEVGAASRLARGSRSKVPKPVPAQPTSTDRRRPSLHQRRPHLPLRAALPPGSPPVAPALLQAPWLAANPPLQVLFPRTLGGAWPMSTRLQRVCGRLPGRERRWLHISPCYSAAPSVAPDYATS